MPCRGRPGPDLIIGYLNGPSNYSSDGGYEALAIGFETCNVGTVWADFFGSTNRHPVEGNNLYRYRVTNGVGRFEHVGMSWLRHEFSALSRDICCTCQPTDGTHLGVGCSDPNTSDSFGVQTSLSPRWQINAHSGAFPYPPANPPWSGSTARRLRVAISDLQVADNTNGGTIRYYSEAFCVAADDAAADNANNNASHKPINVSGSGSTWSFSFNGATETQRAAIYAWQDIDPEVREVEFDVPEVGPRSARMVLANKVTPLAGGLYDYEYALYNQNSDRSANWFSVPVAPCVAITSHGFHDVDYHGGDGPGDVNFDGTDWPFAHFAGRATWNGPERANATGNALRWATLYNFRFVCDAPPTDGLVSVRLFKPGDAGDADFVAGDAAVPADAADRRGDANCDGAIDSFDIDAFVLALAGGEAAWATQYACGYDCACDVNRDGVVSNFDIEPFVECLLAGNCP
ncbi:MAG: hypothetical protein AB7Q17_10095 [Phycisphaerae bacterium]